MENSVLSLLIRHINEEQQAVTQALSAGSAKDFAEYRELCGRITGLARSKYIIEEMRVRLKEQDD
jgi:hypothetical protein